MARAIWQKTVIDNTGAPSNGAQITVTIQSGGAATIFSAQSGGSARSNPFTTGSDGIARFYAERGYYNVTVFKDGSSVSFPWNNLGDKNLFDDLENTAFVASTAFAQTLLDDSNASAARTTLGLGTSAVRNIDNMGALGTDVITASADASVNGLTVGRGAGNISENTAIGVSALRDNTTGSSNNASGFSALRNNTTGSGNNASGRDALLNNTTGSFNNAIGVNALLSNTTGSFNNALGVNALVSNTTGSGNTGISPRNSLGVNAPVFNPITENNRFCMGSTSVTNAYINVAWTIVSDERDKEVLAPVPHGLDFVNNLNPIAFKYKADREDEEGHGAVRYGFKAQDILALEGDNPVIADNEDLEKLRMVETSLIPVLVNAIKELAARVEALEQAV